MHMTGQVTYAELQHAVREKFPNSGPLILKYLDKEGDLVTITDRNDLQVALKEVVESAEKASGQHGGPRLPNMVPPLRIHASRAKSEVSTSFKTPASFFHSLTCCLAICIHELKLLQNPTWPVHGMHYPLHIISASSPLLAALAIYCMVSTSW